jgi:hypothetical protein
LKRPFTKLNRPEQDLLLLYDADGQVTETVDGRGKPSYSYFDGKGRGTKAIDGLVPSSGGYGAMEGW